MEQYVQITRATWSNYENNITQPSLDKLVDIAKFFGITIDDLLLKDLAQTVDESGEGKKSGFTVPRAITYKQTASPDYVVNENEEITLWYLLKEMKEIRKDLDNIKNINLLK